MKKKILLICAVAAFGTMNLAFLKSDISSSSVNLNSLKISAAHADEEYPDKLCTGTPGSCSGWVTYVHN